jgi:pimeloyl-ACP methyl ester carboxylesterase
MQFVLLHGGRHGGWCWKRVAPRLRGEDHEVFTPTLTGLGDRSHLLHPGVGLSTHVEDLVALFEYEDIRDAVLVAHSYGGVVANGAMEEIADRVRYLVYVDAQLPRSGESMLDLVGPEGAEKMRALVDEQGEGWYLPPTDASYWGITDAADRRWTNKRITAQPFKTYTDPVGPTDRAWAHPGLFIECAMPLQAFPIPLDRARERSRVDGRFDYQVLNAEHDAPITAPDELARMLLAAGEVAAGPGCRQADGA